VLLVKNDSGWSFDPDEARDEILSRRIGLKELDVIEIMQRSIEVQAGFRSIDHDGDGVMEFASSVLSGPGQRDGLYSPQEDGKPNSPVGIEIAMAAADDVSVEGVDQDPNPYLGYDFRILTKQGPDAPGGAYDYVVNGALLHKSLDGRGCPFPGQTHPTTSVSGVPSAVEPFSTAMRIWNPAT